MQAGRIELGMFSMPLHRPEKPWAQALREDQEAVLLADALGFSEAWIGEHFSSKVEQIPSPMMFLATLIDRTKSIRFGTGVVNLPHHNPITVAAEAAMFDQLSQGRFMLGIGPGGLPADAELFGHTDMAERGRMVLESIDLIRKLWAADGPFDYSTPHWHAAIAENHWPRHGVGQLPKPWQRPHPPIAMAIVSPNSSSARLIGEQGWIPISANFVPSRDVATHWPQYVAGCEAAGRRPDPGVWRVARNIMVTESEQQARDVLQGPDGLFQFYFRYLRTIRRIDELRDRHEAPAAELNALADVDAAVADMVICGTADTVLDRLVALRDEVGPFGTLLMAGQDWEDPALAKASMHRLAEDVMPRFNAHAVATRAAE